MFSTPGCRLLPRKKERKKEEGRSIRAELFLSNVSLDLDPYIQDQRKVKSVIMEVSKSSIHNVFYNFFELIFYHIT